MCKGQRSCGFLLMYLLFLQHGAFPAGHWYCASSSPCCTGPGGDAPCFTAITNSSLHITRFIYRTLEANWRLMLRLPLRTMASKEWPGLWTSTPGCIQHVGNLFSVSRCVEKCWAEAKSPRLHPSTTIMVWYLKKAFNLGSGLPCLGWSGLLTFPSNTMLEGFWEWWC